MNYRLIGPLLGYSSLGLVSTGSCLSAYYWRPIRDEGDGLRRRKAFFASSKSISDFSGKPSLPIFYQIAQHVVIFLTASLTRMFLVYGGEFRIIHDANYDNFLNKVIARKTGESLITVSNHRSMLDDPAIMGSLLPYHINILPQYNRVSVCAQDYCFNPKLPLAIHAFEGAGKTLPLWRGGGINQQLLHDFSRHVAAGEWIHVFPEGGIWQTNELGGRMNGREKLIGKLKWGVGKLIAHSPTPVIVIPFFHVGTETIIPQHPVTKVIESPIPRPGHKVRVKFGSEIDFSDLIHDHEAKYGHLWKYRLAGVIDGDEDRWESSEDDKILYHKIVSRIEDKLNHLRLQMQQLAV